MRTFIIHRGHSKKLARRTLQEIATANSLELNIVLLQNSEGDKWQSRANQEIHSAEVVVVFDPTHCEDSQNTLWELEQAKEAGKKIINISPEEDNSASIQELCDEYDLSTEFEASFARTQVDDKDALELYKIMIGSSEELIKRRQITNAFYVTLIGGLATALGFVLKEKIVSGFSVLALLAPVIVGILLCRSWHNLLENYGKLNKGKFRVIQRLENHLSASIFSAEWIALGKGLRPKKYRSFTDTEQRVPILFGALFVVFGIAILWRVNWAALICYLKIHILEIWNILS